MSEESSEPSNQLRRRHFTGTPKLGLNLETGYQITEGEPMQGTPSPGVVKFMPGTNEGETSSSGMTEFRKRQQSFEIYVEECEEEELIIDSDEGEDIETEEIESGRPVTPTPIQDFAANTVYREGPQTSDFLRVNSFQNDCVTDVSDADDDEEAEVVKEK